MIRFVFQKSLIIIFEIFRNSFCFMTNPISTFLALLNISILIFLSIFIPSTLTLFSVNQAILSTYSTSPPLISTTPIFLLQSPSASSTTPRPTLLFLFPTLLLPLLFLFAIVPPLQVIYSIIPISVVQFQRGILYMNCQL